MDIRRKIQAGASAWRKVEGVMGDRHIKGKVLRTSKPIRYRDHGNGRKTTREIASLRE